MEILTPISPFATTIPKTVHLDTSSQPTSKLKTRVQICTLNLTKKEFENRL